MANQVYDQHHYHSYTKNTIIDSVNDDCLSAIFMYVPACERPKIALVCQKWKRALDYSWSNVKKLELTHWENDEYPTCLKKYPTLKRQLSFLKSLLYKCGRFLAKLDLTAYDHCNIVPVINEYCPNLVELRLRFTYIDHEILYDAFSRICKLKVLAIIFENFNDKFIPLNLIYSLRNVADTLTDLILLNWTKEKRDHCKFSEETICVIRELKALKRVEISGIIPTQDLQQYLYHEMSVFAVHDDYLRLVETIEIIQCRNTKKLNLAESKVTDDGLYTIANNVKQLKVLGMCWDNITNVGIVTISKINLTVLAFTGCNNVIDSSSISLLKNLELARFPNNNKITDDLATKILENSPKIEALSVLNTSVTVEFIEKAAEISNNRKRNLTLDVSFKFDKRKSKSPYLTIKQYC
ncbi:F-box protein At1g47056-like [Aphidius gifuensis]|uniref:F-box protein At1g47056-like n=1 Tax=Aphidius gifuensis TaxID=684658 RepID=UPI001CDB8FEF|nr:F-box protein At1g47056-like [Aphidius gifuensis]